MKPPSRKSCYNFRVTEIVKVLDGDTIDVIIDLGLTSTRKSVFVSLVSIHPKREHGILKKRHLVKMRPTG